MTMDRNGAKKESLVEPAKTPLPFVPAEAGIQIFQIDTPELGKLDARVRGHERKSVRSDTDGLGARLRWDEWLFITREPFAMPPPSDRPGFDLPLSSARWRWRGT